MSQKCPKCENGNELRTKYGHFVRRSDNKRIQRFKCHNCNHIFSKATFQRCYRQKKRRLNPRIFEFFCSGVSQRRTALLLHISRSTVAKKLIFLGKQASEKNFEEFNSSELITHFQFDDLETIEHTKCKPLSVIMAVEEKSRKILGFSVSQMPAKGHLAKIAFKKYGPRADLRYIGRKELFERIKPRIAPEALIESDQSPHYTEDVKKFFPKAIHTAHPGQRGAVAGQGELKKIAFDPLFTLNHTFAMFRANINRLFRKTWCTTKKPDRLKHHIELYVYYHNSFLLQHPTTTNQKSKTA